MAITQEFKGKVILSSDGQTRGIASGATHRCSMEGCTGLRVSTLWPDGLRTFPCSKGLIYHADGTAQVA